MEKTVIKDLMYGGLTELMNNKEFYYRSGVGADYSHWTEKGSIVMLDFVKSMSKQMHTEEDLSLNKRAKELVIKGLKGETV
jgi:predicted GIY-YIG superfamily endonuclease